MTASRMRSCVVKYPHQPKMWKAVSFGSPRDHQSARENFVAVELLTVPTAANIGRAVCLAAGRAAVDQRPAAPHLTARSPSLLTVRSRVSLLKMGSSVRWLG